MYNAIIKNKYPLGPQEEFLDMAGNIFVKAASDTLGLSDIGDIVPVHEFYGTSEAEYLMHEDNECIYFIIETKKDTYLFTNYALIHIDGDKAVSKKRLVKRYDYYAKLVDNVMLETAGNIDLDAEIKFTIGAAAFDINVNKKYIEQLKDLYKVLVEIGRLQKSNMTAMEDSQKSLQLANESLSRLSVNVDPVELIKKITEFNDHWMKTARNEYSSRNFGLTFQKYINN